HDLGRQGAAKSGDMGPLGQKCLGRQQHYGEGGDFDTATGRGGTGTDKHQHHQEQQRRRGHQPDIYGIETGGTGTGRLEEGCQ
ncbi:hypothetical protein OFN12_31880, partial [Escherichia coli]|nr:hypothetical protein [Escherichia coli]